MTTIDSAILTATPAVQPDARRVVGRYNPFLAALLGWLVPGLGFLYLRRPVKAAVLFLTLTVCMWIGGGMLEFKNISPAFPLHFSAQVGWGAPVAVWGYQQRNLKADTVMAVSIHQRYELAMLYTDVAGLLNFLIIIHLLLVADMNIYGVAAPAALPRKEGA